MNERLMPILELSRSNQIRTSLSLMRTCNMKRQAAFL